MSKAIFNTPRNGTKPASNFSVIGRPDSPVLPPNPPPSPA
ncbi:hypothetical protein CIHG_01033 [Coccidioides immitis H538.4]|uniref:Uncharacterized protein n=1 Tax=Coccidioides immitis H538.4 TaxID=396776 RepID=A0A0J8RF90_COCIT|nr:hypothetical protein CIHG_01033 [Coccidioides immitis H538.4]